VTLRGTINIVGPPAGAFLMEALPMQWVLSVDIITAAIAIGCLLPLAIPQPTRTAPPVKTGYFSDIKQSFRYLTAWRGLFLLVILAIIINFLVAPLNALLPLFVTKYLSGDVLKLGWLGTTFGIGIIAGGLFMGVWGGFKRRITTILAGIIVWSICIILFGFTTERLYYPSLAIRFLMGIGSAIMSAPVGAIFQAVVAKDIQGRFFSLYGSLIGAMIPLGLLIAGPVADAIDLRIIWYISGAAILIVAIAGFFSRDLMNIEKPPATEPPAQTAR
jgi:MFS transporter, DHA3 family, macrolide efflux protein